LVIMPNSRCVVMESFQ